MPKVSINIPVYNLAPWLRRALDSILAQSFTDWECVCVNDGSTDESGVILDEYAKEDSRFKVIHQVNQGVNFARQKALDCSIGEWIASIDGDDWVSSDYLKHLYNSTVESNVDMVWTDYMVVNKETTVRKKQNVSGDAEVLQLALLKGELWGANWNKLYSRAFLVKHQITFPTNERIFICEDMCFNLAFLSHSPKVKYLPVAEYYYVVRQGSALKSTFSPSRLKSGVYVNKVLLNYAVTDAIASLVHLRKKELKANAYSLDTISNQDFYALYPEVRSLKGFPIGIQHQVFFWLAVRGLRTPILWFFKLLRKFKS